jgi:CRP-like cAMP-binding protein
VHAFAGFSKYVASAWKESFMGEFPAGVTETLLDGATESVVATGDVFYRAADRVDGGMVVLILDGLVRTYIEAQSGRQITIRYAWPGSVVGLPALVLAESGGKSGNDWYGSRTLQAEALRETRVLEFRHEQFLELARTEAIVASGVARCLAYLTVETEQMLEDGLFLSVRARVARHLLDLAVWRDSEMIVTEGHREIADAIGSVREVVSRTLVRMRDQGVVERRETETVLLDPAALHKIAAAG